LRSGERLPPPLYVQAPERAPRDTPLNVQSPGDATVCLTCGHLMVFGEDLLLRNPTDAEIVKFAGDKRLLAVQWARGMTKPKPG